MHTTVSPRRGRAIAAALGASVALLLVAGLAAAPAGAQEDLGKAHIKIVSTKPAGGTLVHVTVRITQDNGKPANDALVTATPFTAQGDNLTPIRLDSTDVNGTFANDVQFPGPGQFNIRIRSVGPAGVIEAPITVAVSASTTTPPTTAGPTTTVNTGASTATTPSGANVDDNGQGAAAAAQKGDSGGGMPWWLIPLIVLLVVGGVAAVLRARRNRGVAGGEGDDGVDDGDDGDGGGDDEGAAGVAAPLVAATDMPDHEDTGDDAGDGDASDSGSDGDAVRDDGQETAAEPSPAADQP